MFLGLSKHHSLRAIETLNEQIKTLIIIVIVIPKLCLNNAQVVNNNWSI